MSLTESEQIPTCDYIRIQKMCQTPILYTRMSSSLYHSIRTILLQALGPGSLKLEGGHLTFQVLYLFATWSASSICRLFLETCTIYYF